MQLPGWPTEPPVLTDGYVDLRPWRNSDAGSVFEACQDPGIQHWLPVPIPYLLEHADGFVGEFSTQLWASADGAPFAGVDHESGRLLGAFGLKEVDHDSLTAEVGYWVAPWARGQGVAGRGTRLLCDWAFTTGIERLIFLVEPTNHSSLAVIESLGAVQEELVRGMDVIHGTSRDLARYALARPGV